MINIEKEYVGLYIRLSKEDDDKIFESESIINQKSLLLQYVKAHNLEVYDIYIDDGYSGTNFDRPGFRRMLNDIENKKIKMVITKDMSRLGRDYIGTGELLERYFPKYNVRYIALTDNIDTYMDNSNTDIVPFKAIMNDFYAKDISKKIRASLRAKMKEGKFVGCRTPFGYQKDLDDKNHLIINKEQAKVVKRIFEMSLKGFTSFKIAKTLTLENIKTPSEYYPFKWKNNCSNSLKSWNVKTIQDILTNQVYIGDLVQNKRNKVNYKVKKILRNNSKNYIIVENTHEPIISKVLFYEVQKRLPKNVGRCEKKESHLLDGLLYCGDCHHRISITSRRKIDNKCYTICNYYRTYSKDKLCTTHSNNYDCLEKEILNAMQIFLRNHLDKKVVFEMVFNRLKKTKIDYLKEEYDSLLNEINHVQEKLDVLYLDKINNIISLEQYQRIKEKIEVELDIKKKRFEELKRLMENKTKENNNYLNGYMNNYLKMEKINRILLLYIIEKIEIFQDKTINIFLNFSK